MSKRENMIKLLSGDFSQGNYQMLKDCMILKDPYSNINRIDKWFEGFVQSLKYDPNNYMLLLTGEQGIGKTCLLNKIFSIFKGEEYIYSDGFSYSRKNLYESFIINFDGFPCGKLTIKNLNRLLLNDDFTIKENDKGIIVTDKRLSSYCGTSNYYPKKNSKKIIDIELLDINKSIADKISPIDLFREVFFTFK